MHLLLFPIFAPDFVSYTTIYLLALLGALYSTHVSQMSDLRSEMSDLRCERGFQLPGWQKYIVFTRLD